MSENGYENGQHAEMESNKQLFRIGEVSRLTDTKPFVLRYWETEFPTLQPVKSPKGHRLYRREDVATVLQIKRLLYDEGFTIAGARRHLRETLGLPMEDPFKNMGAHPSYVQDQPYVQDQSVVEAVSAEEGQAAYGAAASASLSRAASGYTDAGRPPSQLILNQAAPGAATEDAASNQAPVRQMHSPEFPAPVGAGQAAAPPRQSDPLAAVNRKVLLDLRDSLRQFLTLLESE